ncbi:unnamed protein product [Rhizoctonia solani]|uniref:Uncharacterized protein n=1 Tax=Rhizoctonia solani TaxID=456999 RepID=A0A8H3A7R6_9AGAM|nr:unnamed protein product [Rhizoctonia solani]
MRTKVKDQNESDEEEDVPRVATSAKKGKRSRRIAEDGSSSSDHGPPNKRRSSSAAPPKSHKSKASKKSSVNYTDSESDANEEVDVDVEGSGSEALLPDDDAADTASSHSSSPAKSRPTRRQALSSRSKPSRVQSDDEREQASENEEAAPTRQLKILTIPRRQPTVSSSSSTPTATKPLRKPVTYKQPKDKDAERPSNTTISSIPSIPRRPKDASAVVKDTQDMDLLNKDVYNQLFNTSAGSKPVTKHVQNEAKQKEIDTKRAAAKAALLDARTSTFDLQLPTDKVLAFENRLRKLHRWYAPSALGFTYHEELRLQRQRQQRPADGNLDPNQ